MAPKGVHSKSPGQFRRPVRQTTNRFAFDHARSHWPASAHDRFVTKSNSAARRDRSGCPEIFHSPKAGVQIPAYLSQIPQVRVLRCEKDWGPATKFIAVVQDELGAGRPDTLIMVVDDDRIYPRDSVELYLHYHQQLPDAALCFRGGPMPRSLSWRHPKIDFGVNLHTPKRTAVITGCGSYLIQPRFFDSSLWDYSVAPAGAFYMDDIWISGCLERLRVEKYVIPASAMMRTALRQIGTMTLHDVPDSRHHHNDETIAFFSANWKVFTSR